MDAEIVFYQKYEKGQICVDLSKTQLEVIRKALGLEIDFMNGSYTTFTDKTLKRFLEGETNPFNLIKVGQDFHEIKKIDE